MTDYQVRLTQLLITDEGVALQPGIYFNYEIPEKFHKYTQSIQPILEEFNNQPIAFVINSTKKPSTKAVKEESTELPIKEG